MWVSNLVHPVASRGREVTTDHNATAAPASASNLSKKEKKNNNNNAFSPP